MVSLEALDLHGVVPIGEGLDVRDTASAPAVEELVVVTDDADLAPEDGKSAQQALLDRIHVLVLVDRDVPRPLEDALAEVAYAGLEQRDGLVEDRGEVEVTLVGEEVEVLLKASLGLGPRELLIV